MTTTRWWWLRHAPVRGGTGLIYGRTDLEIEPPSPDRIERIAKALPDNAVWIVSDLRRTHQTAALLAPYHPGAHAPIEEADFAEMDFGRWEGVARDQISAEEEKAYWEDFVRQGAPGGESFGDVVGRVIRAVTRYTNEHGGRDIVAVAHSGSIKAALTLGAGVTPESTQAFATDPLSLTRMEHTGDDDGVFWMITLVNGSPGGDEPLPAAPTRS